MVRFVLLALLAASLLIGAAARYSRAYPGRSLARLGPCRLFERAEGWQFRPMAPGDGAGCALGRIVAVCLKNDDGFQATRDAPFVMLGSSDGSFACVLQPAGVGLSVRKLAMPEAASRFLPNLRDTPTLTLPSDWPEASAEPSEEAPDSESPEEDAEPDNC